MLISSLRTPGYCYFNGIVMLWTGTKNYIYFWGPRKKSILLKSPGVQGSTLTSLTSIKSDMRILLLIRHSAYWVLIRLWHKESSFNLCSWALLWGLWNTFPLHYFKLFLINFSVDFVLNHCQMRGRRSQVLGQDCLNWYKSSLVPLLDQIFCSFDCYCTQVWESTSFNSSTRRSPYSVF